MKSDRRIAKRYARAFEHESVDIEHFDALAEETRLLATTLDAEIALRDFFVSPVTPQKKKLTAAGRIADTLSLSPLTRALLNILIRKDRMPVLTSVADELGTLADSRGNRMRLKVTTVNEPSADELADITARLGKYFGREAVVEHAVDSELISGFTVEGEDTLIDMSVRGQIAHIISRV
jgi:F-type H+-transporting ATPase subunit delta